MVFCIRSIRMINDFVIKYCMYIYKIFKGLFTILYFYLLLSIKKNILRTTLVGIMLTKVVSGGFNII
jgi:hypothetical protein